jgi:hypothetical protein
MLHLKLKPKFTLTTLFLLAFLLFSAYPLSAQSVERKVRVAARICPPFVMNENGKLGPQHLRYPASIPPKPRPI